MGKFNPKDYETVADRLARWHKQYPESRVSTTLVDCRELKGPQTMRWVVRADLFKDRGAELPDATGWAEEIDGVGGMANRGSALENCETSAIGRALANAGLSGDKRASREEMLAAERNAEARERAGREPDQEALAAIDAELKKVDPDAPDVLDQLRGLYSRASAAGGDELAAQIAAIAANVGGGQ